MAVETPIESIMSRPVITVDRETEVIEIARLMWENDISAIPVTHEGRVIGIVTDYDMISRHTEYDGPMYVPFIDVYFQVPGTGDPEQLRRILATTAGELMSESVITVQPDDDVQDVTTIMYEQRINAVPVVDTAEQLVGIVSRSDIIRLMASEDTRRLLESQPEAEQ